MGQFNLGLCFEYGKGVSKDEADAVDLYRAASQQGLAAAQFQLAKFYAKDGAEQNWAEVVRLLKLAVKQGHRDAHYALGLCYENGLGRKKNGQKAAWLYSFAAERGHKKAQEKSLLPWVQFHRGFFYEHGMGVKQDLERAANLYELAASLGHPEATYRLGLYHEEGRGVPQDKAKAVVQYLLAASRGSESARAKLNTPWVQYELAMDYFRKNIQADHQRAFELLKLAASQGYAPAQRELGKCYERNVVGLSLEGKMKEAVRWYRYAANQKDVAAQCFLGSCYERGLGVARDMNEAARCYRFAVNQGHLNARSSLSRFYMKDGWKNSNEIFRLDKPVWAHKKQENLKILRRSLEAIRHQYHDQTLSSAEHQEIVQLVSSLSDAEKALVLAPLENKSSRASAPTSSSTSSSASSSSSSSTSSSVSSSTPAPLRSPSACSASSFSHARSRSPVPEAAAVESASSTAQVVQVQPRGPGEWV